MLKKLLLILCCLFIGIADAKNQTEIQTLAKNSASWDGKTLPKYPRGQPEISILKIIIPPHSKLPIHYHPVINAGVVLKGTLKVIKTDGKELILKKGDSLIELVNQNHYGENIGDNNVELIIFYAGIKNKPITVKK